MVENGRYIYYRWDLSGYLQGDKPFYHFWCQHLQVSMVFGKKSHPSIIRFFFKTILYLRAYNFIQPSSNTGKTFNQLAAVSWWSRYRISVRFEVIAALRSFWGIKNKDWKSGSRKVCLDYAAHCLRKKGCKGLLSLGEIWRIKINHSSNISEWRNFGQDSRLPVRWYRSFIVDLTRPQTQPVELPAIKPANHVRVWFAVRMHFSMCV